jgi:hypothetical protein
MMPLLTLHQLAHTVWRLQLCADLERMISDFTKARGMLSHIFHMLNNL